MLRPGTLLQERYRIVSVLGEGGMGTVYLAHDGRLGDKPVAIKEIAPRVRTVTGREAVRRQFEKESRVLATLSHPGIVSVTHGFEEANNFYLVMTYVDGETLQRIGERQGRLPWRQVVAWGIELCDMLVYLHSHTPPVVFRDLKPSNVMREKSGRLRLIDFGIARILEPELTATGLIGPGTPAFAATEQFGEGALDGRADLYGLGATMYALMHDSLPPPAADRVMGEAALQPLPGAPAELNRAVGRMMELKAADRYADAREAQRALKGVLATQDTSRTRSFWAGALLLLAVVGLLVGTHRPWGDPHGATVTNFDGTVLLRVPAGTFPMGSDHGGDEEKPRHLVTLHSYYIGRTDVTNAQFRRFVETTHYQAAGDWETRARQWGADAPVVEISWYDAQAYCRWARLRLPTEAEWERAARGTDERLYPWGNTWEPERCWNDANSDGRPHAAGSKPSGASPVGCLDMAGNVWQWCNSKYRAYPYVAGDGREDAGGSEVRVLRGGCYISHADHCTSINHYASGFPTQHTPTWGFRAAR
ncbi:MAG: bifunctional serine/threonine-protein kinase/formylglycine-generating enzyme family protein [Candidatus Xenobia bacterium]